MKYALLFCDQPSGGVNHVPPDEYEEYAALRAEAEAGGSWITGVALMSDEPGVRVSRSGDDTVLAEGPFAEVTDLLSGMFVIEVDSREEALAYAARIPAARNGAVEVRRVLDVDES